jgi:galactokinase
MQSGADAARTLFRTAFGCEPAAVASAPGRVNLIGEHTDYNGGQVLPIAIDRRTWVAAGPSPRAASRCVSDNGGGVLVLDPRAARPAGDWRDYVTGVALELATLYALPSAVDIAVSGNVPVGAGLGSSAALTVAAGAALLAIIDVESDPKRLALAAHRAETRFVGVGCGIMDQFAAALSRTGCALHIRCDTASTEHVRFDDSVLIFDTGARRTLRDAAFNRRRGECERALELLRAVDAELEHLAAADADLVRAALPEPLRSRALHVILENERVEHAVTALRATGLIPGALLVDSHASLRDLYDCSAPELDWFVDWILLQEGVTGARLTGAGWGGCAIATGERAALEATAAPLQRAYAHAFRRDSAVYLTTAAGAVRNDAAV